MDGWKIQELRAAVLSDLHEFIPMGFYRNVRKDEDIAINDYTLAKQLQYANYKEPQFTPRQLTAIGLLEKIGAYCTPYTSPDPVADAAEGITPESIKEMSLEQLQNALGRYAAYLGEEEKNALMPADALTAVEQGALDNEPPGITDGMVTITKLAIKAAWEIECQIKRKASAKEVIERLQEWVTSNRCAELIEIIPRGVKWMTTAPKEKKYDTDACCATLKTWHKNREKS